MIRLSVVIVAKNEEGRIEDCLRSVDWADEVVVLDDHSDDKTVEVCRSFENVVVHRRLGTSDGYGGLKNEALNLARGRWVLSLDADERVDAGLRKEIEESIRSDEIVGYRLRMRYLAFGRWIEDGSARNLRLFVRLKGRFVSSRVHERVVVEGRLCELVHAVIHRSSMYESLDGYLAKQRRYTALTALDLYERGQRVTTMNAVYLFLLKPSLIAARKYLMWGRRYGWPGLLLSLLTGYDYFLGYARLWEIQDEVSSRQNLLNRA